METWQQGQGGTAAAKFIPLSLTPFEKCSGPWSPHSAASKGGTEPFLLFHPSSVALPLQQEGFFKLGSVTPPPPRPHSLALELSISTVRGKDLAGAGGASSGNKSLLTWAKLNSMNFPFWQLGGEG
ncbi:unnamed protein product [Pipistrellus nathusii]|uniref:Uncharacterized protein n=1 Tax=Pipistrellus nathusii TaxID=59473 RepID=A0ABN9Z7J0_PIPNA